MASINESIEQLTASLQQLTPETYNHAHANDTVEADVPVNELQFSKDVETFVETTRAYSVKTRHVSVGTY